MSHEVTCPYCGEPGDVELPPDDEEDQDFTQDCAVCCRPWLVRIRSGGVSVSAED